MLRKPAELKGVEKPSQREPLVASEQEQRCRSSADAAEGEMGAA